MTATIIKNAINSKNYELAISKAVNLPDAYNSDAARRFQTIATERVGRNSKIGGLEKLVAHNFISVETALNLL